VVSRAAQWRTVLGWFALLVAAAVVVVAGIYVVFWPLSDLIARHDVGAITGPHRAAALQAARDAARGRVLTFGAGLFAAGALVYTGRNFTLSRRTVELTLRTIQLAEQGQVTDRYAKAIEQLGSEKLDVRIGSIYALDRIARDSAEDQPAVMEVLTAFVREHSREPGHPLKTDAEPREPGADRPEKTLRPDVQAAMSVIGRRTHIDDVQRLDLTGADLAGGNLAKAQLQQAILTGATLAHAALLSSDLTGALLFDADLTGATLNDANLTGAHLGGADLTDAILADADLTDVTFDYGPGLGNTVLTRAQFFRANLTHTRLDHALLESALLVDAHLTGADLTGAKLAGADLTGALTGANLTGANLTGAHLTGANLGGVLWPPDAVVPTGWQRDTESGRLKRADTDSGGATTD
jgi:uncharacterized protein YjbI with pentapeptide repeats